MGRTVTLAIVVPVLAALAVVLAVAATRDHRDAFELAVRSERVVLVVEPGHEACQRRITTEAPFDRVELVYGTYGAPGPELAMRVVDSRRGAPLAMGTLPAGYPDNAGARANVSPEVAADRLVDVCVRNAGDRPVALFGGPPEETPDSEAALDGRAVAWDVRMLFRRSETGSTIGHVPRMLERASIFRPDPVGAWTFWVLFAGVAIGVPALLVAAGRSAVAEPAPLPSPGGARSDGEPSPPPAA